MHATRSAANAPPRLKGYLNLGVTTSQTPILRVLWTETAQSSMRELVDASSPLSELFHHILPYDPSGTLDETLIRIRSFAERHQFEIQCEGKDTDSHYILLERAHTNLDIEKLLDLENISNVIQTQYAGKLHLELLFDWSQSLHSTELDITLTFVPNEVVNGPHVSSIKLHHLNFSDCRLNF